jgi:hypothetical protein
VRSHGVSDETVARSLGIYVGMVSAILDDPERWLGVDDDPDVESPGLPQRALDAVRDRVLGQVTPASPDWPQQPLAERVDWWVDRIGLAAGLAAAAPRLAGALSDRFPLQAALGAAAEGLAVCAVAREHGREPPKDWVPLLGTVLFDRKLGDEATVPAGTESEQALRESDDPDDHPSAAARLARGAQHSARTLWRLAAAFRDLQHLLDERPRGGIVARGLAKVPVIGVAGGWLDERGGIRKAAKQTEELLD